LESIKGTSHSIEEGMEVMRTVVQQGISVNPGGTAANILKYQDATGADLGVLARGTARFARFGGGDFLGVGYQGLQASGMQKGQYQEFLQAMEKIFEDGVTKGIVRGSEESAGELKLFADIGGKTWEGELGAQRILSTQAGFESSTSLSSTVDILNYRAADAVMKENQDKKGWKEWWEGEFGSEYKGDITDRMLLLSSGKKTPELMKASLDLYNTSMSGRGSREGMISLIMQGMNMKWNEANKVYEYYKNSDGEWTEEKLNAVVGSKPKDPGDMKSPEKHLLDLTNQVKGLTAAMGQEGLEGKVNEVTAALEKLRLELNPPEEPPPPTVEETIRDIENIDPLLPGDQAREKINLSIEAQAEEQRRAILFEKKFNKPLEGLFSTGWLGIGGEKGDYEAQSKIYRILGNAYGSENKSQIQAAEQAAALFGSLDFTPFGRHD
jgi:hypothetical protein